MASDNRTLGRFHLDGIPPAPRGIPQIEVTFNIDASGMLHVSAKDKATEKEQSIRITSSSGLSSDEVEKMKRDANEHAADDKKRKEEIDTRNQADSLVFHTKKQLEDFKDKLDPAMLTRIQEASTKLEEAIKANVMPDITARMEDLNKVWNEASTQMYQNASQQQAPPQDAAPGAAAGDRPVEDADYEVVDDKK
jgi:molecular chaperone DnaK